MRVSQKSGWINKIEKKILDWKQDTENRELHNIFEIGTSMLDGLFGDDQSIFVRQGE